MVELLNSNYPPLKREGRTFPDVFFSLLQSALSVKIASGYISEESIAELLGLYNRGYHAKMSLVVGMHYFEGFSYGQYEALLSLAELLSKNQLGNVYLAKVSKYHGKVYSFEDDAHNYSAIIGSSNLTRINCSERVYETDIFVHQEPLNKTIDQFLIDLQVKYCKAINDISDIKINPPDNLFESYLDVKKLHPSELANVISSLTKIKFEIEIKPEEKSHLNCYHGKGRRQVNGIILPRPWYEANVMVSNKITKLPYYPFEQEFTVITDDGYTFKCVTNGDYAKNFRSEGDLQILGRWLKGRMENKKILKVGDKVIAETFKKYGRNTMTLVKTSIPGTWYLDFGVDK